LHKNVRLTVIQNQNSFFLGVNTLKKLQKDGGKTYSVFKKSYQNRYFIIKKIKFKKNH